MGVDETGRYRITKYPPHPTTGFQAKLPPGTYTIAEVHQDNFNPTLPRELVFESLPNIADGGRAIAIGAGDFDADGYIDLAVANQGSGSIELLLNDGAIGFALSQTVTTGIEPTALLAVELSGDSHIDLLATTKHDATTGRLIAFTNDGTGAFVASFVTVSANPIGLATGDFDGDQDLDVAITHEGSGSVSFLFNNGNGVFTAGTSVSVGGSGLQGIGVADLDGDRDLDVVVTIPDQGEVAILLNQGDGSFVLHAVVNSGGAQPKSVALCGFRRGWRSRYRRGQRRLEPRFDHAQSR